MSLSAGGHRPDRRKAVAGAYAAHLMRTSPTLSRMSGMNASLVQNYLHNKMDQAARDTDRALAEYGHIGDMANPATRRVHRAVVENYRSEFPTPRREGIEPLVDTVVSPQAGWMAEWKSDPQPKVEEYAANELGQAGVDAVRCAETWVKDSQSPALTREDLQEFQEAGELAQLQQVQKQAGGQVPYGAARPPDGPTAGVAHKGSWVPSNRGYQPPTPGGD